ncbi:MAG: OsmC family protein [Alphaproteobacteria bacterium]
MQDMINGVDRTALFATIDAVKADPQLARFEFRLQNEWMGGGLNRSTVTDFHGTRQEIAHETPFVLMNDEPPVLLSGDKGPNPVENLLHALAGCLTTSIVYHAAARGMKVAAVRTRFEGDLDLRGFLGLSPTVRKGYQGIRAVFDIEGDLTTEEKRALMAMGPAYSPVFDVVTNGTPVACTLAEDMVAVAAE